MSSENKSKILLGYKFTKSYFFKAWRLFSKIKKHTNPHWYRKYLATSKKYSHFSPDWVKRIIVPSKAFHHWLKINAVSEAIKSKIFRYGKKILPLPAKIFLKKHLPSLFVSESPPIKSQITREWSAWLEARADKAMDIIDFSVIAYTYRIQRPQHLAMELTKLGHRVFYIENEFCYSGSAKHPQIQLNKYADNLYLAKLSSSKNYFIYNDTPSSKDKQIIIASLKLLLRQARIINPIAKIDHPFWAAIAHELGMPIVYDIMDLHSGFKETSDLNLQNEKELLDKSDLILASSDYIKNKFRAHSSKIISLKNAGEYRHFARAARGAKSLRAPVDMQGISGPIIGYYGALADWLDTDLIEGLASKLPKCQLVLIGLVTNPDLIKLAQQYPNIHLLGEKLYTQLPNYLALFDVCLIPFKLTKLIQATNPVKIYEYFSSGKPVVATSIPELMPYRHLLYTADDVPSFVRCVKQALAEKSSKLLLARQSIARKNTWTHRALTLEKSLLALYPKVSIIVLTYNQPDLSKITIDSVINRSKYPSYELIIVDNDSDVPTKAMLQKYSHDRRIKLMLNPANYGFAGGNNVGMHKARGDYLVLLNNDVKVTPGWLERLVYHAHSSKRIGLVGPVTNSIGNEAKISIGYDPQSQLELENQAADYTYSHWGETRKLKNIAAFAWLKSRKTYKLIGDLDERFGKGLFEDDDYCVRVRNKGLDILCVEDAFVHHYGGASMKWNTREYQQLFEENQKKFEQKWAVKWSPHKNRKSL